MNENKNARTDAATSSRARKLEGAAAPLNLEYSTSDFPIASHLHVGRENALGVKYLCSLLGFKNSRTLRKQIEAERCSGAIIAFDGELGGYFVPATVGELRHFVGTMEARTRTTDASIRAARDLLREVSHAL